MSNTYGLEWNARIYPELARQAVRAVAASSGALVDATFRHLADRQAFASSFAATAPLLFIECQAPRWVLAQRAAQREQDRKTASNADLAVVLRERQRSEPLDEVPANAHVALQSNRPFAELVDDVVALLGRRLARLAWPT